MNPNDNIQAEDNPKAAEPKVEIVEPSSTKVTSPKPSFWNKVLPWVIVAVVFFLAGSALIYFWLYQPEVKNGAAIQAQLSTASEKLTSATTDLAITKTDLESAQAAVVAKTTELEKLAQTDLIHKFQADVNSARVSLLKLDPASARQALNFAKADFAELEKTNLDTNSLSGFKARLEEADANFEIDPQKSLDALDTLSTNLLLLVSNL
jgi:cytoskeletal protein RodZ